LLIRHCGKWNHLYADVMFKSRQMAQAAVDDFFCELGTFLPAA
jgi:1,2-phenylacetyl-CoA epoxidase catalytic subunit